MSYQNEEGGRQRGRDFTRGLHHVRNTRSRGYDICSSAQAVLYRRGSRYEPELDLV